MPRIRKKTTRRQTTRDRVKIGRKISEGNKKKRKLAKKNPQWKSRHPKDPGIPNSLPFKDQILAEVAEERRRNEEEKRLRRMKQKNTKKNEPQDESRDESEGQMEIEPTEPDGVTSIPPLASSSVVHERMKQKPSLSTEYEPPRHDPSIPNLGAALNKADVWLYVLDARDPSAHRNIGIERLATEKAKKIVFLLNKADLCPREALQQWLSFFERSVPAIPVIPFRVSESQLPPPRISTPSASNKTASGHRDAVGIKELLKCVSPAPSDAEPVTVAVIGLPNSGKSSVINSILGTGRLATYKVDSVKVKSTSTTTLPQLVEIKHEGSTVTFIDTPGFVFQESETASAKSERIRDQLIRCRGRIEKMNQAEESASWIISRAKPEDLIIHYNTPAFLPDNPSSFLSGLARVTGRLRSGGLPNITESAQSLLWDWRLGKFTYYTLPPKPSSPDVSISSPKPHDDLLSSFLLRKELEKQNGGLGLIRLNPENPDERLVNLEFTQNFEASEVPLKLAKVAKSLAGAEESEEAEDSEEAGDEDGSDPEPPVVTSILSSKRKRVVSQSKEAPPQKPKKVSFIPTKKDKKTKRHDTVSVSVASLKSKPRNMAGLSSTPKSEKRLSSTGEEYDFQQFF